MLWMISMSENIVATRGNTIFPIYHFFELGKEINKPVNLA